MIRKYNNNNNNNIILLYYISLFTSRYDQKRVTVTVTRQ